MASDQVHLKLCGSLQDTARADDRSEPKAPQLHLDFACEDGTTPPASSATENGHEAVRLPPSIIDTLQYVAAAESMGGWVSPLSETEVQNSGALRPEDTRSRSSVNYSYSSDSDISEQSSSRRHGIRGPPTLRGQNYAEGGMGIAEHFSLRVQEQREKEEGGGKPPPELGKTDVAKGFNGDGALEAIRQEHMNSSNASVQESQWAAAEPQHTSTERDPPHGVGAGDHDVLERDASAASPKPLESPTSPKAKINKTQVAQAFDRPTVLQSCG
eukprot:scaffold3978_cov291-Pinguiococcus_pyrenoidosus.AAC.3